MALADVLGALFTAANSFLTGEGLAVNAIAWPNEVFDPAGKPVWAGVNLVPNSLIPVSLGEGGTDRGTGFLQIDIAIPVNTGNQVLRSWENAAHTSFTAGKTFSQNGQNVMVTGLGVSQIRTVDNWAKKSFTIAYRFEINRPSLS